MAWKEGKEEGHERKVTLEVINSVTFDFMTSPSWNLTATEREGRLLVPGQVTRLTCWLLPRRYLLEFVGRWSREE